MSGAMKLAWLSCPTDAGCIAAMFSVESGLWSVLLHVAYIIWWFLVFYSFLHTSIILFKNKYTLLVPWRNPFKKNDKKGEIEVLNGEGMNQEKACCSRG